MTTEWKLVPVEPTDDMIVAFAEAWYSRRQCIDDPDMIDAYRDMLAAAPVPPASVICDELAPITEQAWRSLDLPPAGDVEVVDALKQLKAKAWHTEDNASSALVRYDEVCEIVEAHVTRLSLENARLQAELKEVLHTSVKEDVFDVVCKERDALKAELAELAELKAYVTIPLRERTAQRIAMQSDLTKAQELFDSILDDPRLVVAMSSALLVGVKDFLTHQSAPAAKGEQP